MCEVYFDEYCTVWRESAHRSRKYRRCGCCGGRIRPGGVYVNHFSIFDGDTSTANICQACWFIREEFREAHHVTLFPGTVREYLEECIVSEEDEGESAQRWRRLLKALKRRKRLARSAAPSPEREGK
jgi:hypothetical protein